MAKPAAASPIPGSFSGLSSALEISGLSDKGSQLLLQDIKAGSMRTDPGSRSSLWGPACSLPLYTHFPFPTSFPADFKAEASDAKMTSGDGVTNSHNCRRSNPGANPIAYFNGEPLSDGSVSQDH